MCVCMSICVFVYLVFKFIIHKSYSYWFEYTFCSGNVGVNSPTIQQNLRSWCVSCFLFLKILVKMRKKKKVNIDFSLFLFLFIFLIIVIPYNPCNSFASTLSLSLSFSLSLSLTHTHSLSLIIIILQDQISQHDDDEKNDLGLDDKFSYQKKSNNQQTIILWFTLYNSQFKNQSFLNCHCCSTRFHVD